MNFIFQVLKNNKLSSYNDKIIVLIYGLIPIFLIIGTAISEIFIILLCLKFIIDFFLPKKAASYNRGLLYFLILIYFVLLLNLIFSLNFENSFSRNFFFFKYIFFVIGTINHFSTRKNDFFLVIKIWTIIIFFFSIDLLVQFITNKNIVGMVSPIKYHRVSGFMGNELKAGSLILAFCFIIYGYLIQYPKLKLLSNISIFFLILIIFLTGDRSNFFKSILVIIPLMIIFQKKDIFKNILFVLITAVLIFGIITKNKVFNERFENQIFNQLYQNNFNIINYAKNTEYGKIYLSAFKLYNKKKIFGVGNKNYRIVCENNFEEKYALIKSDYNFKCNTHPHQIYFEILSEHGILGVILLFICIITFIFQNLIYTIKYKDILLGGLFFSILITFIPLLPGGSFFTSFNATLFWLNISFFYSYKNLMLRKNN